MRDVICKLPNEFPKGMILTLPDGDLIYPWSLREKLPRDVWPDDKLCQLLSKITSDSRLVILEDYSGFIFNEESLNVLTDISAYLKAYRTYIANVDCVDICKGILEIQDLENLPASWGIQRGDVNWDRQYVINCLPNSIIT